jgi:hypothetical protein
LGAQYEALPRRKGGRGKEQEVISVLKKGTPLKRSLNYGPGQILFSGVGFGRPTITLLGKRLQLDHIFDFLN